MKKANSTRAFLTRNIPRCCIKLKQMAYATYVRLIVEYASLVWDPNTKRNTSRIEMVQCRCARYVTYNFDRTSSVTSMIISLNWSTLNIRRRRNRLTAMYRILHNQVDVHWQSFLNKTLSCTWVTAADSFYHFARIMFMPHFFLLALVKTGITLL